MVTRTYLCMGDKAGSAVIIEGLENDTYSDGGPTLQLATVYMKTYCHACKKAGFICPAGPRLDGTAPNGQMYALSGDINICDCNPAPVFWAQRNMTETITSGDIARMNEPYARSGGNEASASPASEPKHARWFFVWDSATGEPLVNRDFVANVAGARQSGKTDGEGYAKITTDGEQSVNIHIIFSSPKRDMKPNRGS